MAIGAAREIKSLRFSKRILEILFLIAYHLNEFRQGVTHGTTRLHYPTARSDGWQGVHSWHAGHGGHGRQPDRRRSQCREVLADYPYLEREDSMQALRYAAWRAEEREVVLTHA